MRTIFSILCAFICIYACAQPSVSVDGVFIRDRDDDDFIIYSHLLTNLNPTTRFDLTVLIHQLDNKLT